MADGINQRGQIDDDVAALALQPAVAVPVQRNVEERELPLEVVAGKIAGASVFQHVAGGRVLAQVNRQVKTKRLKLEAQFEEVRLIQCTLPKLGAGVEEREWNELIDAGF